MHKKPSSTPLPGCVSLAVIIIIIINYKCKVFTSETKKSNKVCSHETSRNTLFSVSRLFKIPPNCHY